MSLSTMVNGRAIRSARTISINHRVSEHDESLNDERFRSRSPADPNNLIVTTNENENESGVPEPCTLTAQVSSLIKLPENAEDIIAR